MKGGGSAQIRKNGSVRQVQTHGMTINRGMRGGRQPGDFSLERAGNKYVTGSLIC